MYPVSYASAVVPPAPILRSTTLEPSRSYLQPGDRRSPAVIQIRPTVFGRPIFDREAEDLARMQEEFIISCQFPLRKLPEEVLPASSFSHYRIGERSRSPLEIEGRRKSHHHQYRRSRSKSPRSWRRNRSKSRSPRRQSRQDFSPPGTKSPSQTNENSSLIRNK